MNTPQSVWIELTNICNQRCSWCFQNNNTMTRKKGMMTRETYERIISEIESFKPIISLHLAGESFLHKDLYSFIEYAKKHDLEVGITTNGTLLQKDDYEILRTGIDSINISLAGVNKQDYTQVRGVDEFDRILNDVSVLAGRNAKMESPVRISVNITETEQNTAYVDFFKSKIESTEGIYGVIVRRLMDWHGSVDVTKMSRSHPDLNAVIKRFVKENDYLFSLYIVVKKRSIDKKLFCDAVYSTAGFLWDGTVVPCCGDFNGSLNLGNINNKDFLEIWNGEEMTHLRTALNSVKSIRSHPICGPCIFYEK